MATYSPRRVLSKELEIFNRTGVIIMLLVPTIAETTPAAYVPGNMFSGDVDAVETAANYSRKYIRAKFEETDSEQTDGPGRRRYVKGIIVVPMLLKAMLAQAEYIDPYLDGSRFVKMGALVDESRLFCTQSIESLSLTSESEVN